MVRMNREMVDLAQRMERAEERGTLLAVINDLQKALPSQEEWQQQYLLNRVLSFSSKLAKLLTASEINSHLSALFDVCSPFSVLLALHEQLASGEASENVVYRIFSHIERNLETMLRECLENTDESEEKEQRYTEMVGCLISLRDRSLKIGMRKEDENRVRDWLENYENHLFSAICSSLSIAFQRIQEGQNVSLKTISLLLTKGRHLQIKDASLLDHVVHWLCSRDSSPIWDRLAQRIFTDDSHGFREFEALVIATVLAVDSGEQLLRCLGYSLKTNECVRLVCTRRLLLQRVYANKVPRVLAEYVEMAGGNEIYVFAFKDLMTAWADVSGIKFNAVEKQKYLTVGVLEFGRRMSSALTRHWREIAQIMVPGVSERLANSDLTIRQSGMFVAEMCSKWQDDKEKLTFDYEEDDWLREMRRIASGEVNAPVARDFPDEKVEGTSRISLPDLSKMTVQPSATVIDSDDEEEEFGGGYIPEEELNFEKVKEGEDPERGHPPPNYLRDAMNWLDEKEKYERFEAAFFSLEPMIRRKAVGFSDFAPRLVQKLVYLTDRFSTKRFEEVRKSALIACLIMKPELAPALGDVIFARSATFSTRYLILSAFMQAAKELSEPPKAEAPVKEVKTQIVDESDWRQVVEARIRAKTRIISEKRPAVPVRANRFAPVATLFFYPLLRTSSEEHLQLRGRDAPFLAKILFVAGEILQCASTSASVVKMASSLNSLVTPLRFHTESSVRSAVLFCYFSIASAVPPKVLIEVFPRDAESWLEWACSVADDVDLSAQDRAMGQHVAAVLVEKMRAAQET